MTPDLKFQCAARVFLAKLLETEGTVAPEQLGKAAGELEDPGRNVEDLDRCVARVQKLAPM